jgi:tRNA (adenine37-N6)-methyltransferase
MPPPYLFEPIGIVRSPFDERAAAPRQASVLRDVVGRIELFAGKGYEHALEGLGAWEYAWVLFVFHRNVEQGRGWKAKVLPPRSDVKQGVFATRSPHRPNPIGLSAVAIDRVDDLVVHVRGLDLLEGTPVLDLKPYVAYADSRPEARAGWLEGRDPARAWDVRFGDEASSELAWLRSRGVELEDSIGSILALGPQPHPYRRIRSTRAGCGWRSKRGAWISSSRRSGSTSCESGRAIVGKSSPPSPASSCTGNSWLASVPPGEPAAPSSLELAPTPS